jgi:putative RecB family exonuclease
MAKIKEAELALNANDLWLDAWERLTTRQIDATGQETASWRAGGRATKEYPDKENGDWWAIHGAGMVQNWIDWREQSHGMGLWVTPEGIPAIELVLNIELEGVPVKMALDRLMVTQSGDLVVVDLKTGKNTPSSSFQLGMYAVGMELTFGVRPKYGTYWAARDGVTTELIDLDKWTIERAGSIVKMFDNARRSGIFVPNFDHCKMCNFTSVCKYQDGEI